MPNLLKIGYTLKSPELRAKELYTTGVPTEYIVEYWILVDNPYNVEQQTHLLLKEFNCGKEWFKCNFEYCYYAIQKACETKFYDEYIKRKENKQLSTYILIREQEQIRIKREQEEKIRKQQEENRRLNEIIYKKQEEENERNRKIEEQRFKEEKEKSDKEAKNDLFISALIIIGFIMYISDGGKFHIAWLILLVFAVPLSPIVAAIRMLLKELLCLLKRYW